MQPPRPRNGKSQVEDTKVAIFNPENDCTDQNMSKDYLKEHIKTMNEIGLPIPKKNNYPKIIIQNQVELIAA